MPGRSPSILAVLVWLRAMEELYSLWSWGARPREMVSSGDKAPCSPPVPADGRDEVYLQGDKAVALALLQEDKHRSLGKVAWIPWLPSIPDTEDPAEARPTHSAWALGSWGGPCSMSLPGSPLVPLWRRAGSSGGGGGNKKSIQSKKHP